MNKKIVENAIENVFNNTYKDMHSETKVIIDGEEQTEMINFERVKDHCSYIIKQLVEMFSEDNNETR